MTTTRRMWRDITHEEFGQECIESESMLPDAPGVCIECGHLVHLTPEQSQSLDRIGRRDDDDPVMLFELSDSEQAAEDATWD